MAGISSRDISRVLSYSDTTADRASNKVKANELSLRRYLTRVGGMERCSKSRIRSKKNLTYNGGFEYSNSLDIDPIGWSFENAHGVVLDYRYQPADPAAYWVDSGDGVTPTSEGALEIQDFYYRTGVTSRSSVYMIGGTDSGAMPFDGPLAERIQGSNKFCVVQSDNQQSYSFSASTVVPIGSLVGGGVYYLEFYTAPFGAYLPDELMFTNKRTGVAIGQEQVQLNSDYMTSEGYFFIPFANQSTTMICGVEPTLTFVDEYSNTVAQYTGDRIVIAPDVGWANPTFMFVAPEGATGCTIEFRGNSGYNASPVSFILDSVSIYQEDSNQRSGSIETYVAALDGMSAGQYIPCMSARSASYIYGIRAMYSNVTRASTECDIELCLNKASVSDIYGYMRPDFNRLDKGFLHLGKYVDVGDEIGVNVIGSTSAKVKLYFDMSTL